MSRFYVPEGSIKANKIIISGKEAHHILDVMRLGRLDKVVTFDGTGREYVGFIKDVKDRTLVVEVVETRTPLARSGPGIALIQAIPKKEKMDYIVEKATELGVSSIIPIMTKRTVIRWDKSKMALRVERWRRIAKEASKQCARTDIPKIDHIRDFRDALEESGDYDVGLIATLSDESVKLKEAIRDFKAGKIVVAIGPEGDFTPDEIRKAKDARFKPVSLGSRVLKSDTASLAALAILNYEFAN